jgi:hypothetical protein
MYSKISALLWVVILFAFFITSCSKSAIETNQSTIDSNKIIPFDSINISEVVGVCHVGGQYHFTGKPFLIEGAEEILKLGSKCIKVWFEHVNKKYPYNSSWPIDVDNYSYADLAQTNYFQQLFSMPFKTYSLELTNSKINWKDGLSATEKISVYNSMYDLTKYLLTTYKNTGKTFVLQNWEGDGALAPYNIQASLLSTAIQGMIDWTNTRQDAVTQARKDIGSQGVTVVNVFEVSSVLSNYNPGPYTIDVVAPYTHSDLYSYSSYSSRAFSDLNSIKSRLEYIKTKIPPSKMYGSNNLMIGEFGYEERGPWPYDKPVTDISGQMQLYSVQEQLKHLLDWGVVYVFYWQIYCNEEVDITGKISVSSESRGVDLVSNNLKGYWLVRPDGSLTPTYNYFKSLFDANKKVKSMNPIIQP